MANFRTTPLSYKLQFENNLEFGKLTSSFRWERSQQQYKYTTVGMYNQESEDKLNGKEQNYTNYRQTANMHRTNIS